MIRYFHKRKKEKELQKKIQHEVLETLCTICLSMYYDKYHHSQYNKYMRSHFVVLKKLSEKLREEIREVE